MDYSAITSYLIIGNTPLQEDYAALHALGVKLLISMRWERRPYPDPHNPPLQILWLRTIDHPLFPIPLRYLERGAAAALQAIETGGKVYTHCAAGRHRGVAMGAAILIGMGYSPQAAMDLIKEKRPAADPQAGYIRRRIVKFARHWQKRKTG